MPNCLFCYKDAGSAEYHASCCKKFFGTGTMPVLELNDQIIKELAETTISRHIAITGVQPKLSVNLEKAATNHRLTIVGLWGQYILKPQHHDIPEMPQNEDLTMHLAAYFGINTCGHCLMKTSGGGLVYLAKRFDRINNSKIHMEDFCQLAVAVDGPVQQRNQRQPVVRRHERQDAQHRLQPTGRAADDHCVDLALFQWRHGPGHGLHP